MAYNFDEHKHRYAAWTAARAVQRSFPYTSNDVENAIIYAKIREFSESNVLITQDAYDTKQKEWCKLIIDHFSNLNKSPKIPSDQPENYNRYYGRASKIIAIYLKTTVILLNKGEIANCSIIHPPIDRILLNALATKVNFKNLTNLNWTTFEENDYWKIVEKIRSSNLPFNWLLEEYWDSNQKRKDWLVTSFSGNGKKRR